jgi:hypothetical protein
VSRRADFTNREWAQIKHTVECVGFGMLAASRSGPVGKLREIVALARCLTPGAVPAQFSQNELVAALLETAREDPLGPANYLRHRDLVGLALTILIGRLTVLTRCERTAALLAAKCSHTEAEGLKQWLLWIATTVAEASGDRWLGLGRRISDEETTMLNELATALRICTVATIQASSAPETTPRLAPPSAQGASRAGDG